MARVRALTSFGVDLVNRSHLVNAGQVYEASELPEDPAYAWKIEVPRAPEKIDTGPFCTPLILCDCDYVFASAQDVEVIDAA